jgi:hypothetical protein
LKVQIKQEMQQGITMLKEHGKNRELSDSRQQKHMITRIFKKKQHQLTQGIS